MTPTVHYFALLVNLILTAKLNIGMLTPPRVGLGVACDSR